MQVKQNSCRQLFVKDLFSGLPKQITQVGPGEPRSESGDFGGDMAFFPEAANFSANLD